MGIADHFCIVFESSATYSPVTSSCAMVYLYSSHKRHSIVLVFQTPATSASPLYGPSFSPSSNPMPKEHGKNVKTFQVVETLAECYLSCKKILFRRSNSTKFQSRQKDRSLIINIASIMFFSPEFLLRFLYFYSSSLLPRS